MNAHFHRQKNKYNLLMIKLFSEKNSVETRNDQNECHERQKEESKENE